ncbi:MAG: glutamate-1-semialdehyde 2,1-aminomutase [Candidatus Omnitrophota bacterium]|jgi:glutamate-1-semialdehyde 2,1-aminomutase
MAKLENTDHKLFTEAKKIIPGGVNSPVRSFKAVEGDPVFIKKAFGSKLYSEKNKEYIDYCLSWGAMILGHAHPRITKAVLEAVRKGTSFGTVTKSESELARLIVEAVPSIEQVRLTNSGTEAVMGAVRLARAFTGKNKIIKFEGAYHGHADYLLAKAGSGLATFGVPVGSGVPEDFIKHTIVLPFNDVKKIEETAKKYNQDLAAIIVEPVAANCGVIIPREDFLPGLRKVADKFGIVLIFDEVITGFRLSYGGAQEYFQVEPDLTCLGKIIGGGLPVGAFGGRKEIMRLLSPEGDVYQAGTLAGNPVTVAGGIAALSLLKETMPYGILGEKTSELCGGIKSAAEGYGIKLKLNTIGSMFSFFFEKKEVFDYAAAKTQGFGLFKRFFHKLLAEGVYLSPSPFEANFLSLAHTAKDIEHTVKVVKKALKELKER